MHRTDLEFTDIFNIKQVQNHVVKAYGFDTIPNQKKAAIDLGLSHMIEWFDDSEFNDLYNKYKNLSLIESFYFRDGGYEPYKDPDYLTKYVYEKIKNGKYKNILLDLSTINLLGLHYFMSNGLMCNMTLFIDDSIYRPTIRHRKNFDLNNNINIMNYILKEDFHYEHPLPHDIKFETNIDNLEREQFDYMFIFDVNVEDELIDYLKKDSIIDVYSDCYSRYRNRLYNNVYSKDLAVFVKDANKDTERTKETEFIASHIKSEQNNEIIIKNYNINYDENEYELLKTEVDTLEHFNSIFNTWGINYYVYKSKVKEYLETSCAKISLGDCAKIIRGKAIISKDSESVIDPIKVINIRDINDDGTINWDELETIENRRTSAYLVKEGDVIITTRGTVIKSVYIDEPIENIIISSNVAIIRATNGVSSRYIHLFIESPLGKEILKSVGRGVNIFNLSPKTMARIMIPHLSTKEQKEITEDFYFEQKRYITETREVALRWKDAQDRAYSKILGKN